MRQDRATGQYSMHRMVHQWVRERPEMSTSHQALWCQVSMTTLAWSIRRPPHGDTADESRARRELLPHIRHVRKCQDDIKKRLEENRKEAKPKILVPESYGRLQAEQDVRFSRVYAETGHLIEARELQERALGFVSMRLGSDHPLAIWLSLFLTKTLWEMTEIEEATQRQRKARQLCVNTWGEDHPLTLDVTDLLGSALYMKGRWDEAMSLHTENLKHLRRLYGEKHEKTLRSVRNLARVHFRWFDYDEAARLYRIAWEGMRETLGETHLETLVSFEDLAMSNLRYEADGNDPLRTESLAQSLRDMVFVHEQRKEVLGEENPYTLLAILHIARLKSAMGQHESAEQMIREGLEVAERNVDEKHMGMTMAKTIHAEILTHLGRFGAAEALFHTLIDKRRYAQLADEDGDHPDRLTALWFFVKCLEKQGKYCEALERSTEFVTALAAIGGQSRGMKHKVLPEMRSRIVRLSEKVAAIEAGASS